MPTICEPSRPKDKLRDGPCSSVYELLEKCAESKGINMANNREKLQSCPTETDALIKCVNKNPKYFY